MCGFCKLPISHTEQYGSGETRQQQCTSKSVSKHNLAHFQVIQHCLIVLFLHLQAVPIYCISTANWMVLAVAGENGAGRFAKLCSYGNKEEVSI